MRLVSSSGFALVFVPKARRGEAIVNSPDSVGCTRNQLKGEARRDEVEWDRGTQGVALNDLLLHPACLLDFQFFTRRPQRSFSRQRQRWWWSCFFSFFRRGGGGEGDEAAKLTACERTGQRRALPIN